MKKTQQTAAIYNRWLFTLGGGEQVAFAYAETLRDLGYETTMLTHKKVDLDLAEKKMNVNLKNIHIQYLPLENPTELSHYSEHYDVFINTSYLDYFPNRSKKGILSVFFPGEIYLSPTEYIKRKLLIPSLRNFFIYPTQFEGFKSDTYDQGRLHKWLGKSSSIYFTSSAVHTISIRLYFPTFSFSAIETLSFSINDTTVTPKSHTLNHATNTVKLDFESQTAIKQFTISKQNMSRITDISLIQLTIPSIRYTLYNHFKSIFPKWEMRLHGGPGVTPLADITSYQHIVTISQFCQKWIRRYWGLSSTIVFPPVDVSAFAPAQKKQNFITHVGRFFVTGHSKKQLELIKVFKDLVLDHHLKGWELHLIGSVYEGKKHQQYFEACVAEAAGLPVFFHLGIPFTELRSILSQSKIYWHATGLDENPDKQPILMEHFGITTVEAMASGCVPVVINAGGQPEIVTPECGFVWKTREELQEYTLKLVQDEKLLLQLRQGALQRSTFFSREAFKKRFAEVLDPL